MKQIAVIGLGNLGYYLAVHLAKKGHEVLAMDTEPEPVQKVRDQVSRAVVADASDVEVLQGLGLSEFDLVLVCIGRDMSVSLLVVLHLQELGVSPMMVMAISEEHGRVLRKMGVKRVFLPERDFALDLVEKIHHANVLEFLPSLQGYSIIEQAAPVEFVDKSLGSLGLIEKYGIQVIGIREDVTEELKMLPPADYTITEMDRLILLGPSDFLDRLYHNPQILSLEAQKKKKKVRAGD